MLVIQEKSETAGFDHQAALDKMESLKEKLDSEVGRWYGKYRAKMVALQEMSETLQETRAGREIARGQAKILKVKKEYVEDKAAESSTMAEQLAAANERARLSELESQDAIAQLGETVELKKKLEESLVRVAELEAQLSSRSGEEGSGDVVTGVERQRGRGDRETTQTSTTTQQAPISVELGSAQATLIKSQANIIANQRSTLRRLMADIHRELHPDSEATIDSTHANDASQRATSPYPTANVSLLEDTPQQQLDTNTSDPAVSESQESRGSLLANMTIIDVYNVLRKQYGPNACREPTAVHDSGPVSTDGVEGGNDGAEGPGGGLIIDGLPVRGISAFPKTIIKHNPKPNSIQDAAPADLRSEHIQLQHRHVDLQKRYNAIVDSVNAIHRDNCDNHAHYLKLLRGSKRREDNMRREGHALLEIVSIGSSKDAATIVSIKRISDAFEPTSDGPYGALFESPYEEAGNLRRKHLFHSGRIEDHPPNASSARAMRAAHPLRGVCYIPSRHDRTTFPETWEWLDQESGKLSSDNTSTSPSTILEDMQSRLSRSRHGQWVEVKIMTFSWAFYKLLDSGWVYNPDSKAVRGDADLTTALQSFMLDITRSIPDTMWHRYALLPTRAV